MKRSWRPRSLLALLALLLSLMPLAGGPPRAAAADAGKFNPPKQYYLALGDSLAYGYQQAKYDAEYPTIDPSTFNTGYVDGFSKQIAAIRPHIQIVNYACPGESTATFLNGGCDWPKVLLHSSYPDSQMQAAIGFLEQHHGQVSPITIDLGANDVVIPIKNCLIAANRQECLNGIPSLVASAVESLDTILSQLRAAAPYSEIIVLQYYNPFAAVAPSTSALVKLANDGIAQDAARQGARVADAFTLFNGSALPQPATLCSMGPFCPPTDVHPNDTGYGAIATQLWAASGYARLQG